MFCNGTQRTGAMHFDPDLLCLPPSRPEPTLSDVTPQKREAEPTEEHAKRQETEQVAKRDPPSLWCGGVQVDEFNVPVPASAPALLLPPPPLPLPLPPPLIPELVPVRLEPRVDARREKFKFRDPKFPMAGLMREEGGVFAFIDSMKAR